MYIMYDSECMFVIRVVGTTFRLVYSLRCDRHDTYLPTMYILYIFALPFYNCRVELVTLTKITSLPVNCALVSDRDRVLLWVARNNIVFWPIFEFNIIFYFRFKFKYIRAIVSRRRRVCVWTQDGPPPSRCCRCLDSHTVFLLVGICIL